MGSLETDPYMADKPSRGPASAFLGIDRSAEEIFAHANYLSMTMLYARMIDRAIIKCGITATQYRSLLRLIAHHGSLRTGQIADMLDIGASAITATVAQLEDAGAVIRVDGEKDRRAVHVIITERGRELAAVGDAAVRPVLERIRDDFPDELRRYCSICTLKVAQTNGLFGDVVEISNVNTALCDEILLTSMLVTHITHDEGISLTGYRILLALSDQTDGMRPNEVARHLGMRMNGIATAQSELLRRRFILRDRDATDRRAVLVEITSDGYAMLRRTAIAMSAALATRICPDMTDEDLSKHRRLAATVVELHGMR